MNAVHENIVRIPIDGVCVGHHTDTEARTGCTVVLFPDGSLASGEVRGGAPATREFALLDPTKTMNHIDAVVLSGGSAFGLAASDGVMQWCAEQGRGFVTAAGPVPIVVGMCIFDLMQGDVTVRPTAADGHATAARATAAAEGVAKGLVGAGTGATVGKWRGADHVRPGGLGVAVARRDDLVVAAILAVNALGDIDDDVAAAAIADGTFTWPVPPEPDAPFATPGPGGAAMGENTTIGVIVTNARLDKVGCRQVAESGHDGFARALFPAHTRMDGDALVAVSVPAPGIDDEHVPFLVDAVRILATVAVEQAVRSLA